MLRSSKRLASWEIYSNLKARPPLIVRADGRGFKKILENCKKPYDLDFARSMVEACIRLFQDSGISPTLVFTFSDEINLLFLGAPFAGRVEKIDSIVAGFFSAALSLSLNNLVSMDCRVIPICEKEIEEYLAERQNETWRNHVFSYGFYTLIKEGLTNTEAMKQLRGMREHEIHEQVFRKGVNLARTPDWERRGILIYRKEGQIIQNWDLPLFKSEQGHDFLLEIIDGYKSSSKI